MSLWPPWRPELTTPTSWPPHPIWPSWPPQPPRITWQNWTLRSPRLTQPSDYFGHYDHPDSFNPRHHPRPKQQFAYLAKTWSCNKKMIRNSNLENIVHSNNLQKSCWESKILNLAKSFSRPRIDKKKWFRAANCHFFYHNLQKLIHNDDFPKKIYQEDKCRGHVVYIVVFQKFKLVCSSWKIPGYMKLRYNICKRY